VTLVVQNSLGLDTLIKSEYIQVYTGTELYPECDFIASNNLIEEGNSINFLDLSANNPTSWTWFFEGADPSFSTQQNPTGIYYASPGYYNVTLIANNPSGSDTLTQTAFIEVYSQNEPIADFAASITEVALGSSVDFVDITQNNPTSWTWFFPGGNPAVSVDENPSNIVYSTIGAFDVTLVTSNPSGTDTIIKTNYINVVDATAPSCDFIANNTTINQASSIDFADLTQNNPTSWTWLFPGGNPAFSTLQNPTNIAYDSVGTFDVTLIVANDNGNDTLIKHNYIEVLSSAIPVADFMVVNTTIFEGETIDYIDLTQNNPTSWTWLFDGASPSISNEQNPLGVQYNSVGTFDVTLITVNDNGIDTLIKSSYITVIEDASPNCDFIASDTSFMGGSLIDFLDLSTNNPNSWTWFFEGGNPSFSTQQNPTQIVYENQGNYDVTLIAENSFGLDTITKVSYIEVTSSVGINNNIEKEITIYPNPTENTITIDLASTQLPVQLSLTDLSGRIIQNLNAIDSKQIIDLSQLSKGIYIIKLSSSIIYKELKVIKN
jgi:PKD repeat protein